MANIMLKDKNGANIVYKNVDYVSFQTLEGGTVRFNERIAPIITVTELPAEDINDSAVYRVVTKDENGVTTVQFFAHEESGEWVNVARGAQLTELMITENGEYVPVGTEDGYTKVTVGIDTFIDVEEFPTENIDQEAVYRVVRQDEETGATHTTYGIFDADDTKTVLEYNAEEGWVECGAGGGDIRPIEITANGTYDAAVGIPGGVGDLEPGAWYTYKHEIPREDIETLYSFANENGELHQWVLTDVQDGQEVPLGIVTKIVKIGNEYMLMTNNINGAGQFYCTAEIIYNEKTYPAGWSIAGQGTFMGIDTSIPLSISNPLPVVMRMPEVIDNTTILGADGMLDFFKTNLLAKKVNREVAYVCANDGTGIAGTIGGKGVKPANFELTLDQLKEPPIFAIAPEMVEQYSNPSVRYMVETAYQFMLFHSGMMGGAGVGAYEDDGIYSLGDILYYIKNLAAVSPDINLEGDFQDGAWYMAESMEVPLSFYTYYPAEEGISPCDGYNPVVVNIPNADTIVEVDALPTSGVESDKIYKKVDRTEKYQIMGKMENGFVDLIVVFAATAGVKATVIGVDALPETLIPTTAEDWYIYIILTTGEIFESTKSGEAKPFSLLGFNTDQFGGTTEDPNYVPEDDTVKYFFLKSYDEFVTYGLPNNGTDKQYFEYNENTSTWEELDSGDMLMERVDELPAENVNDNKVYCVKNEIEAMTEVYINQDGQAMTLTEILEMTKSMMPGVTVDLEYYVVDKLPSSPVVSVFDPQNAVVDFHVYILNDTGEQYVSTNGSECVEFCKSDLFGMGEYMGKITDASEATEEGFYTIMRDYSINYTYGIPNDGNNKSIMVYRNGEWVRFVEETPVAEPEEPVIE